MGLGSQVACEAQEHALIVHNQLLGVFGSFLLVIKSSSVSTRCQRGLNGSLDPQACQFRGVMAHPKGPWQCPG